MKMMKGPKKGPKKAKGNATPCDIWHTNLTPNHSQTGGKQLRDRTSENRHEKQLGEKSRLGWIWQDFQENVPCSILLWMQSWPQLPPPLAEMKRTKYDRHMKCLRNPRIWRNSETVQLRHGRHGRHRDRSTSGIQHSWPSWSGDGHGELWTSSTPTFLTFPTFPTFPSSTPGYTGRWQLGRSDWNCAETVRLSRLQMVRIVTHDVWAAQVKLSQIAVPANAPLMLQVLAANHRSQHLSQSTTYLGTYSDYVAVAMVSQAQ